MHGLSFTSICTSSQHCQHVRCTCVLQTCIIIHFFFVVLVLVPGTCFCCLLLSIVSCIQFLLDSLHMHLCTPLTLSHVDPMIFRFKFQYFPFQHLMNSVSIPFRKFFNIEAFMTTFMQFFCHIFENIINCTCDYCIKQDNLCDIFNTGCNLFTTSCGVGLTPVLSILNSMMSFGRRVT